MSEFESDIQMPRCMVILCKFMIAAMTRIQRIPKRTRWICLTFIT